MRHPKEGLKKEQSRLGKEKVSEEEGTGKKEH